MKTPISVKILDIFKFIFTFIGVDYNILRKLLVLKISMDKRKSPSIYVNYETDDDNRTKKIQYYQMFSYIVYGLIFSTFLFLKTDIFVITNLTLASITFISILSLLSEISQSLFDSKDRNILVPRSVDPKVINLSKILHTLITMYSVVITISILPIIVGGYLFGVLYSIFFFICILLIGLMLVFATSLLYGILFKFASSEKLKDIVTYIQIFYTIMLVIITQLSSQFSKENILGTISFEPEWWINLFPTSWFAAIFPIIFDENINEFYITGCSLALIVPIVSILAYIKFVIPYFERNLYKLEQIDDKHSKKSKNSIMEYLSKLLCFDKQERAFFIFADNIIKKDRKIKLTIYSNLAIGILLPIFSLYSSISNSKTDPVSFIQNFPVYIFSYYLIAISSYIIFYTYFSSTPSASWIYKLLPVQNPSSIFRATFKVYWLKYQFFPLLIICLLSIFFYGITIIPDIVFIILVSLLMSLIVFKTNQKQLPFSVEFKNAKTSGSAFKLLINLLFTAIIAVLHYYLIAINITILIPLAILSLILYILWKSSFKLSWFDVYK